MAHFGDLAGRKRMFMLSILLMSLPVLVNGIWMSLPLVSAGVSALLAHWVDTNTSNLFGE